MIALETLVIALRSLRTHQMRSILTMFGMIIEVGAVILLVACGQGIQGSVNAAIEPIANNITVIPKIPPNAGGPAAHPLTDADADAMRLAPHVTALSPTVTGATVGAAGQTSTAVVVQIPGVQFRSGSATGTTTNWLSTNNKALQAGTFFTATQYHDAAKVAVLGPTVATNLFGPDPAAALGRAICIHHRYLRVIGVLKSYGAPADSSVVVPMTTARAGIFGYGYGGHELSGLNVNATSSADVPLAEAEISRILQERHNISDARYIDFQIQDLGSRLTSFNQLFALITSAIPAIAAISLVVGGIGVLNIMFVSVTERTREIGTRKAIGATDLAIMTQFIAESIALAAIGGIIGVFCGVGTIVLTSLAARWFSAPGSFMSTFTPVLSAPPIILAFSISLAIGLVAGTYPAWRAARLNPIDALRFE